LTWFVVDTNVYWEEPPEMVMTCPIEAISADLVEKNAIRSKETSLLPQEGLVVLRTPSMANYIERQN
jgi:hypothetical protein